MASDLCLHCLSLSLKKDGRLIWLNNHLAEEESSGCFSVSKLWLSDESVFLPHDAVDWSAVCDCGISWLFSLLNSGYSMKGPSLSINPLYTNEFLLLV